MIVWLSVKRTGKRQDNQDNFKTITMSSQLVNIRKSIVQFSKITENRKNHDIVDIL